MWVDTAGKALLYSIYCIYTQIDFPKKHDAYADCLKIVFVLGCLKVPKFFDT